MPNFQNSKHKSTVQNQVAYVTLSHSPPSNDSFHKLSEIPVNFLFKTHENEWIGCELQKNQIDNFTEVYNPDRKLKKLEEIIRRFSNKNKKSSLQTNTEITQCLNMIQHTESLEFLNDKNSQLSLYFIKRLNSLKTTESFFKAFLIEEVDKLFSNLKSKYADIKEKFFEEKIMDEQQIINANLHDDEKSQLSNNDKIELVSMMSVPNSYIISHLDSNFSEEVCHSLPFSIWENMQLSENNLDSNQLIKSANLISPIQSDCLNSNQLRTDQSRKRKTRLMIEPSFYTVSSERHKTYLIPKVLSKQDKILHTLFDPMNCNVLAKKFYRTCIGCKIESRSPTIEICCYNYICEKCFQEVYSRLLEIFGTLSNRKNSRDCFVCLNNLFYCTYCLVFDLRENLVKCEALLCKGMFHLNCYKTVRLIERIKINNSAKFEEEFYPVFSGRFLKEYNPRESENLEEIYFDQIKKMNHFLSEKNQSRGQESLLQSLYKVNSRKFSKMFTIIFTEEINNYFESMNDSDVGVDYYYGDCGFYCHNHLCLECFLPIIETKDQPSKICCNALHKSCINVTNSSVNFNIKNNNSCHFPLIHFIFYKKIYDKIKGAMQCKIIIEKKIFYENKQIKGKILSIAELIESYNNFNRNVCISEANLNLNSKIKYELLSKIEIENLNMTYNNIETNVTELNLNNYFPNIFNKDFLKCECMKNIVRVFEIEEKIMPDYLNNFSKYFTLSKFKKFLEKKQSSGELINYMCSVYSDCSNRKNSIECSKENCYVKQSFCGNRHNSGIDNFQIVKTSNMMVYGLISKRNYEKGDYLMELLGEVIDESKLKQEISEFQELNKRELYWCPQSFHNINNGKLFLNSKKYGNIARFINHSNEPNSTLKLWTGSSNVKNVPSSRYYKFKINKRFLIFCVKKISENEEITINFTEMFSDYEKWCVPVSEFRSKISSSGSEKNKKNKEDNSEGQMLHNGTKNNIDVPSIHKLINSSNILLNLELTANDCLVYKKSKIFLIRNVLHNVSGFMSYFHSVTNDASILKNSKLFSYFQNGNCSEYDKKINLSNCNKWWQLMHVRCSLSNSFEKDKICLQCEGRSFNNYTLSVNKCKSNSLIMGGKRIQFQKDKKIEIFIIHTEEKSIKNKIFRCIIYEKKSPVFNSSIEESRTFNSIFYEYIKDDKLKIKDNYVINQINDKYPNYPSLILTKKFELKGMQINNTFPYSKIREYINDSNFLFRKLVDTIQ